MDRRNFIAATTALPFVYSLDFSRLRDSDVALTVNSLKAFAKDHLPPENEYLPPNNNEHISLFGSETWSDYEFEISDNDRAYVRLCDELKDGGITQISQLKKVWDCYGEHLLASDKAFAKNVRKNSRSEEWSSKTQKRARKGVFFTHIGLIRISFQNYKAFENGGLANENSNENFIDRS